MDRFESRKAANILASLAEKVTFASEMLGQTPLQLNDDFRHALDVLEKTDTPLFITGKAGTGKSTLLQLFRNTSHKKMAILAQPG